MKKSTILGTVALVGSALCAACSGNILDATIPGVNVDNGGAGSQVDPSNPSSGAAAGGGAAPGASDPAPSGPLPDTVSCPKDPLGVNAGSVRLSALQFKNSVGSLFPFAIDVGTRFPASAGNTEFTTSADANAVLADDIPNFADTAEAIALQAVAANHIAQILPCTPTGNEAACARQFIDAFAARAYRRPLEAGERDPLVALYDGVRAGADPLDFNLAIGAVIAAVLQSPPFLYRLEIGTATATAGVRKLTAYEAASKLSYLYWDAPPDAALLDRAKTGAILDPTTLASEASRLLKDPKARPGAWHFFSEWLGFGDKVFDGRVDAGLAADFVEESKRFVLGVVLDSPAAAVKDLLDNAQTQVNSRLAKHYGLPYSGTGPTDWQPATLPASMKAGVLSKAQVATASSPVGETSFVKRGKFVHDRLLCVDLGAAPPGAQSMNPVLPPTATPRQRSDARMKIASCAGCHTLIDNVGLGLEDLDAVGRPRTNYASGAAVDARGKVVSLPGNTDFNGTAGLASTLADNSAFSQCLTRQWYRYATGHHETAAEASCHVAGMSKRFADSGFNVRELMLSVAGSDAFLYRSGGGR